MFFLDNRDINKKKFHIYSTIHTHDIYIHDELIGYCVPVIFQAAVYATFATTLAALQGSLVAVTGIHSLQWSKLCNIYTRFCVQVGGSLVCSSMASLAMALLSSVSAYRLFRLYPCTARSVTRAYS